MARNIETNAASVRGVSDSLTWLGDVVGRTQVEVEQLAPAPACAHDWQDPTVDGDQPA
jgi:hypothetical protein